jgi:hypothetical protein
VHGLIEMCFKQIEGWIEVVIFNLGDDLNVRSHQGDHFSRAVSDIFLDDLDPVIDTFVEVDQQTFLLELLLLEEHSSHKAMKSSISLSES